MERVCEFLKKAGVYYLATVEGDQPRVRPFGTAHIFEGKLYIQTGKSKPVSRQLAANPKAEICAFHEGKWVRIAGELVEDDRVEAKSPCWTPIPISGTAMMKTTAIPRCCTSAMQPPLSAPLPRSRRPLPSAKTPETRRPHPQKAGGAVFAL